MFTGVSFLTQRKFNSLRHIFSCLVVLDKFCGSRSLTLLCSQNQDMGSSI